MNAPDKIYVIEYPDWVSRFWVNKKMDNVDATLFHEYIRKDALLEWLKERRAEHSFEVRKAYQRTIEKIETL